MTFLLNPLHPGCCGEIAQQCRVITGKDGHVVRHAGAAKGNKPLVWVAILQSDEAVRAHQMTFGLNRPPVARTDANPIRGPPQTEDRYRPISLEGRFDDPRFFIIEMAGEFRPARLTRRR